MVLVVTSTVRDSVSSSGALNPKHDLFLTLTKCFLCLNITRAPNISLVCRNVSFANICPADWVGSFALVFISLNSFLYLFNYVFFFPCDGVNARSKPSPCCQQYNWGDE